MRKIYICFLTLFLYMTAAGQETAVETALQDLMKKTNTVGLAVAVVKNSKLIYTHSFGLKDIDKAIPLTDNDIFRIASISKSFSATAIMQLVEAG